MVNKMEIVIAIAMAVVFLGGCVGIAFALHHGINVYAQGKTVLSNVILVVSIFGIFGVLAIFATLSTLL
jgi:hypothetical protein